MITTDDVKKLANLARIDIPDDEAEHLAGEITGILDYVKQVTETDVSNVGDQAHGPHNVFRDDEDTHESGLHTKTLLESAPDSDEQYLKVKDIL